jgi:hypothetical protein
MKRFLLLAMILFFGSSSSEEISKNHDTVELYDNGENFKDGLKLAIAGISVAGAVVIGIGGTYMSIRLKDGTLFVISSFCSYGFYKLSKYSVNSLSTKERKELGRIGQKIVTASLGVVMLAKVARGLKATYEINKYLSKPSPFDIVDTTKYRR